MSIHIDEVLDYLDAHPIGCYEGGVKSLMELLHEVYTEYNTIDSEEIQNMMRKYNDLVADYPDDREEQLFLAICGLCQEHEVLAFSHGIVVGMNLMTEVRTLP